MKCFPYGNNVGSRAQLFECSIMKKYRIHISLDIGDQILPKRSKIETLNLLKVRYWLEMTLVRF